MLTYWKAITSAMDLTGSTSTPGKRIDCTCTSKSPEGEVDVWLEPRIELAQNHGLRSGRSRRSCASWKNDSSKLKSAGAGTGDVEVTSISRHGFLLYLGGRELFVDFRRSRARPARPSNFAFVEAWNQERLQPRISDGMRAIAAKS